MHILLSILTAAAGLIWALYRLHNAGVNLNGFNPFYWARRRAWEKKLGTKPLHRIENSMEAAAVLVVAAAELEGSVTREHKALVIELFCKEFAVSEQQASEMYAVASHMLKDTMDVIAEVPGVLAPTKDEFEQRHKDTLLEMLQKVSEAEGPVSKAQSELIEAVQRVFEGEAVQKRDW